MHEHGSATYSLQMTANSQMSPICAPSPVSSWGIVQSRSSSPRRGPSPLENPDPSLDRSCTPSPELHSSDVSPCGDNTIIILLIPSKSKIGQSHARFYLPDGNVIFRVRDYEFLRRYTLTVHCPQVENTLYCVHRYFFQKYSEEFAVKYKLGEETEPGQAAFIQLEDVRVDDFDQMLAIFYPR
jgi:hypothetical protein